MATIEDALRWHRSGNLLKAQTIYERVLLRDPLNFSARYYLGLLHAQSGRPAQAIPLFEGALQATPRAPELLNNLGMAHFTLGNLDQASSCYQRAIELRPTYANAWNNWGTALGARGLHAEAIEKLLHAVRSKPDYPEALNNLGVELALIGRIPEAIDTFRRAVHLRPDFADAYVNLGNALLTTRELPAACEAFDQAVRARPADISLRIRLGDLLSAVDRPDEARDQYELALRLDPHGIEPSLKLGHLMQTLSLHVEAIARYELVLQRDPNNLEALESLGFAFSELGNVPRARKAFQSALSVDPTHAKSYYGLSQVSSDPALVNRIGCLLDRSEISSEDRTMLQFAIGKCLDDAGQSDDAFLHIMKGNAEHRGRLAYDEPATLKRFAWAKSTLAAPLFARRGLSGLPSKKPIFILGMMRSGSTLVEQILAAHSTVQALGERQDFQRTLSEVFRVSNVFDVTDLDSLLTTPLLQEIGQRYLRRIEAAEARTRARASAPGIAWQPAGRLVDKMPENFLLAGLIHLIFPNAAIIHTRRDPVDTCVSCYSTLFAAPLAHTYGLEELGRYYRAYSELMDHWGTVLPEATILHVQYENLVSAPDTEIPRILSHCGLEWEESCRTFYKSARPVRTASMHQVRRPLYLTSVGRWRRYARHLDPLLRALGSSASLEDD